MLTSYAVSPVLFNLICDTSRLDHRNLSNYLLVRAQVDNKKESLKTELNRHSAVHTRTIACAAPWLEPARQNSLGTFPVTYTSSDLAGLFGKGGKNNVATMKLSVKVLT